MTIITKTILDHIQALSNERQQLWRIAHRDKFSPAWWKRHDRIVTIGKQLVRLWHMHRVEMADAKKSQPLEVDHMTNDYFYDYRVMLGVGTDGIWRVENETSQHRRYITVEEGFLENQNGHYMRQPARKLTSKPNVGARKRQRAAQGMIQLN